MKREFRETEKKATEEKRKKTKTADLSLGVIIDLLTEREWDLLTDLYLCRCMPRSALVDLYFLDTPDYHYQEYSSASFERKKELEEKNRNRAIMKTSRTVKKLKDRGLIESSSFLPDTSDKPIAHRRNQRILGETWYYLSSRGLKIVEMKRGILEENKISKNDLDMERAKKEHFWELAKVYLDVRYKWLGKSNEFKQFQDWDWYPSMSVHSDDQLMFVRPDAILRFGNQIFYVELDRSTEPIQRSPFYSDQVSIEKKLERYRDVIKLSSNVIIKNGIIAFVVPEAKRNTRLNNILRAAEVVFGKQHPVYAGKDVGEILSTYSELVKDRG
ncbi:hypothetical protein YDYSY3_39690 [Paenibacillus chitinolyticus]|uniref:replication-relaxation family protein n=1 Tax=Paenibacillus chitinolyticus TaxID=79263 RepID=UPI0026E49EB8|nr:replication-relaxation family protein [Paenibacillus chitinolyticus]GKS12969.1 hypothetical protein YDYSY3_39690 [Paenibacillus chitinolyticus]